MEQSVKQRIIDFAKAKNLSQRKLETLAGWSNGYINNLVKSPTANKLNQLHTAFPDLNMQWLLTGAGSMLATSAPTATASADNTVPLIPTAAMGGSLGSFTDAVKMYDCERILSPVREADFAIRVSGDSMAPEYPSGSIILIKRVNEKAFIDWGHTYVLDTVNGAVIKKLLPTDNETRWRCVSVNPDYPPFDIALSDIIHVFRVLMMMTEK